MKKAFCIMLMIVLAVPCFASADVLADGWEDEGVDELKAARKLIDQRIAELSMSGVERPEGYVISGNGTEIRDMSMTLHPLSRFVFTCKDADAEYTITVNGEEKRWISKAGYFNTETEISRILIQSKEPWTIDVSPIGFIDTPFISGNGNNVSDRFVIDSPSIVTVTFDYTAGGGNYWNERCSLILYKVNKDGSVDTDYLISSEEVFEGKTITLDAIVNIEDGIQYCFWGVTCNSKIKWSITAK